MKKLMVMLAAVAMAACAQAVMVNWNTGLISDPNGERLGPSSAYTAIVTLYADAAGQEMIASQTSTSFQYMGFTMGSFEGLAPSTTYYISAVIRANDGSVSLSTDIASFTTPNDDSAVKGVNFDGDGFDTPGKRWGGTWETAAVPEPTSGLLLLLGMAGLALKRKVA